jgi:hypothetical protein
MAPSRRLLLAGQEWGITFRLHFHPMTGDVTTMSAVELTGPDGAA